MPCFVYCVSTIYMYMYQYVHVHCICLCTCECRLCVVVDVHVHVHVCMSGGKFLDSFFCLSSVHLSSVFASPSLPPPLMLTLCHTCDVCCCLCSRCPGCSSVPMPSPHSMPTLHHWKERRRKRGRRSVLETPVPMFHYVAILYALHGLEDGWMDGWIDG